jgi:hypothetical protein
MARMLAAGALALLTATKAWAICPYDVNCLNNPYSGRDGSSQGIQPAPFGSGPGQYNPSYVVNPVPSGSSYNPYSPPPPNPNSDVNPSGVPLQAKGLGLGPINGAGSIKDLEHDLIGENGLGGPPGPSGSLRGVDVDKRIQNARAAKRALPSSSGSLKGVDPDLQR